MKPSFSCLHFLFWYGGWCLMDWTPLYFLIYWGLLSNNKAPNYWIILYPPYIQLQDVLYILLHRILIKQFYNVSTYRYSMSSMLENRKKWMSSGEWPRIVSSWELLEWLLYFRWISIWPLVVMFVFIYNCQHLHACQSVWLYIKLFIVR